MQRTITLVLTWALALATCAQAWCAPGAEWTYAFDANQQASGVTRAWYSGDSLLGGYTAQRIDQTIYAYQPELPFGQPFTQELNPLFTRYEAGVVYLWDNPSGAYDTLMWFGAVPGEHWNMHHQDGSARFDVLDTGTTVVAGVPLHYLVVEEPIVMGVVDTLRERVGSDYFYIDPLETLTIDWTTGWLHCYRDNALGEFHGKQWPGECDFTVGLPVKEVPRTGLFPNPGSDHFQLYRSPGVHTVTVIDATGRIAVEERITDERTVIGTAHLPSGIYMVRVDGSPVPLRWVKN